MCIEKNQMGIEINPEPHNNHVKRLELEQHLKMSLPTLTDVRRMLHYNPTASKREKVITAFVIGSVARKENKEGSDLDIAVIIPTKQQRTSLRVTEHYHSRFIDNSQMPHWNKMRVDFQFFYTSEIKQIQEWAHLAL